ncbi:MAG: hypothetical protein QF921_14520 [Pseudomonadales bacterium]|nr:hypothetical protein [Pseudomonadales bacterium]MDP6472676.1 hypothetical protein [Pseudomonadales bacterium]MDP6827888.1 hypothetical protein [Pseudomonadales bacterium]MDP6972696.1 hypothetical protein [Pseudomonadales bacterium]
MTLSGTILGKRYAIRVAIVSYRTHREHLSMLLEDINTALEEDE